MNNNNYCVIMGGGIGSRFWPFSRKDKPKQFLDLMGTGRTLIQMTFDRFKKIIPIENIFIVTNREYGDLVAKALPELDSSQILMEPMRRNTAPCIAYASYHIKAINKNANIVVAPSDHLILKEDEFIQVLSESLDFVEKHDSLLTLGICPSRPETGYGYIQVEEDSSLDGMKKVKLFTEKPNLELAKIFCQSGEFLWNSGIFIWSLSSILKAFHDFLPEIALLFDNGSDLFGTQEEEAFINQNFPFCPNISIDYGIMEKASNVYVRAASFGWSDLGTWHSLYEVLPKDESANVTMKQSKVLFFDSSDNIVALPKNKIAVIQGLNSYVVADVEDVLMICKKEDEARINQFVTAAHLKYGDD